MKPYLISVLLFFLLVPFSIEAKNQYPLAPYPNVLVEKEGQFTFESKKTMLLDPAFDATVYAVVDQFSKDFARTSGIRLAVKRGSLLKQTSATAITFVKDSQLAPESYILSITPTGVVLKAAQQSGLFYGLQTIKQLLPLAIWGTVRSKDQVWTLPCCEIQDSPRFVYRGAHLDVSRHFFGVETVKTYIDLLAMHKMNTFHWHLTDDQGWRIEIKQYPRLTEVGSVRRKTMIQRDRDRFDTIPQIGFYTQKEVKEIVAYAAARSITVIPEIDMPGHMVAALAAYPELGCTGGPYEVWGQWGVHEDVLCAGKELTYQFAENVLKEVVELFPSKYIHIGGDECPKTRWSKCLQCQTRISELGLKSDSVFKAEHYLQSYFIRRMEQFLNKNNRQIIGWDEILEGGAAPNATIMSWRGTSGGIEAARKRHDVIMTPEAFLYLNYYQTLDTESEPLAFGGYLPVEKIYAYEPMPEVLNAGECKYILGVQANLWTEYIQTDDELFYHLLPRLAAVSEIQWTEPKRKEWSRFLKTTHHITGIYQQMGVAYAKHVFEISPNYKVNALQGAVEVTLQTADDAPIYYTLDGSEPTVADRLYTAPVQITQSSLFKAAIHRKTLRTKTVSQPFLFHKGTAQQVTLCEKPNSTYTFNGASVLADGIRGTISFGTGRWLGFLENPLDVIYQFKNEVSLSSVTIGYLIESSNWIFPPCFIEVFGSDDGITFTSLYRHAMNEMEKGVNEGPQEWVCSFPPTAVKYLKVVARTTDRIPQWHGGAGSRSFLFVDEIVLL